MAKAKIRIISAIPGAASLGPIVAEFCGKGSGIITSLSDQRLRVAHALISEDSQVEVAPFGEVVGRYLLLCGEQAQPMARKGHIEAAIAEACEGLFVEGPFAASAKFPGTHRSLQRALAELRSWGIDHLELRRIAEQTDQPALREKLLCLAELDSHLHETLDQLGLATNDDRIRACLTSEPEGMARLGRLLMLAGSEASPNDLAWIHWAGSRGAQITLVVDTCASSTDRLFEGADRIVRAIGLVPEKSGIPNELAQHLFASDSEEKPASHGTMMASIASAADSLAEVEWALRGCLRDASGGIPIHEIALYVRHLESYAPLIEFASARLDIPIQMARRTPLNTNAFARLVLAALDFCASRDVRSLLPLLKSSYLSLNLEAQAEIGGALKNAHGQRSSQWPILEEWAAGQASEIPWLAKLLKWRSEVVHERATMAGWIDRLRTMVDTVEWIRASADGPAATRERDVRARNALQRALAQQASVMRIGENRRLDLIEFAHVCRHIVEESDTSVPGGESGIQVVRSAEQLGPVQSLYVLGMLEGVFPRRRRENPILSDDERAEISGHRPETTPLLNSHDAAREERDEFYRVCAAPTRKITLSYPLTDDERDNVPAFYLEEVRRTLPGRIDPINHPRSKLTPGSHDCLSDADRRLLNALESDPVDPLPNRLATEDAAAAIRSKEREPFEPRELREILECPFRWLASQRLRLRVDRDRSRWSALRGLPQRVQLAKVQTREDARAALLAGLRAELDRYYSEASEYDLALLEAGGRRLIEEWVDREFGSRELWPKDEGSIRTLQSFGDESLRSELALSGGPILLEGEVGSTAKMGPYNVAMVTEGRKPKEDPESRELSDLDKLEMGLLLLALHVRGAGAAVEAESMHGERTLYVLPRVAGVSLQSRRQDGLRVVDLGDPESFYKTVKMKLREALRRMSKPDVDAEPDEHCRWCDFGELCRRHLDFSEAISPFDKEGEFEEV